MTDGSLRKRPPSSESWKLRSVTDVRPACESPLIVCCEHGGRPLSRARPAARLNKGIRGQGNAVDCILVAAGDVEHAEAQNR